MLPFAGVTFVLAGVASMGMPGFSGFVAEFQVLMGAWKVFPENGAFWPASAFWWAWLTRCARCKRHFIPTRSRSRPKP